MLLLPVSQMWRFPASPPLTRLTKSINSLNTSHRLPETCHWHFHFPLARSLPCKYTKTFDISLVSPLQGVIDTAQTLCDVASRGHEQKGLPGAVGGVLRQIPPTVVRPLIVASEATSNLLGGMRNQIKPDARKEDFLKWRTEDCEEWRLFVSIYVCMIWEHLCWRSKRRVGMCICMCVWTNKSHRVSMQKERNYYCSYWCPVFCVASFLNEINSCFAFSRSSASPHPTPPHPPSNTLVFRFS